MNPDNTNSLVMQNPLEIPEILNHVLGYVKGTETLLNCRLVAHSWNQVAVELLNNKGCTIGLHSNNMHPYVDLMKSSANSSLSRVNSNIRLRFPQWFSFEGSDSEYDKEEQEFSDIVQLLLTSRLQVRGLTLTTTPWSIGFRTKYKSTPRDTKLQQLLQLVAPTLSHLKLIRPMNCDIINKLPTFPNLISIHCFGSITTTLSEYLTTCIVNSSKLKLKSLQLITNDSREAHPIFNSLKSNEELNLDKLELSVDHLETYNHLGVLKSSHLRKLVLQLQTRSIAQQHVVNLFGNFIPNNYPNLSTLELHLTKRDKLIDYFAFDVNGEREPLQQITTFGFYLRTFINSRGYEHEEGIGNLIVEKYLGMLIKFPCLTTIKLDIEALIRITNDYTMLDAISRYVGYKCVGERPRYDVLSLDTVTNMEIYLNLCCYGEVDGGDDNDASNMPGQRGLYRTINYLMELLWPNGTNLTLKQKLMSKTSSHPNYYHVCMDPETYPHVPYNLLKAIITPWSNRLRRLRIKNYIDDWLNTMVAMEQEEEGNTITEVLSDLELLSIDGGGRRNSNSDDDNIRQKIAFVDDKKGKFDLSYFLERIQSVQEIEVDEALLQNGPGISPIMEQIKARNLAQNTCIQLI